MIVSGPKSAHQLGALVDRGDRRLGLDVVDDLQRDLGGPAAQHVDHPVDEAQLGHRRVGDDGHPVHVGHVLEVADRVRLEVRLRRHLEPLEVVVAPADPLDVHQVDRRDVVRDGVRAVAAAAERQRRDERVVDVADAAVRGRRVPDHPDRLDPAAELLGELGVLGVDRRAVAQAVELDHLLGQLQAVLAGLGAQHREHRRQLLPGQRLGGADLGHLGHQDRGVRRGR